MRLAYVGSVVAVVGDDRMGVAITGGGATVGSVTGGKVVKTSPAECSK